MTHAELEEWESDLQDLFTRIHPLFYRTESRRNAEQYLRGLLSGLDRKNGWTIAEHVGESGPKPLQRLLNLSPWDADELLRINRDYAMEHLADPDGILVADPTGFAKKGKKSVGVQRQYSGTLGRVDNSQIATFLAYVTPGRDRVLIDRRLYLPKSWVADPDRCAEAGVPAEVGFQTRPQQVQAMIASALEARMPFGWFTADEEFGQNPGLCDYLETNRLPYVMAVPKNTRFTDTDGNIQVLEKLAIRLRRNTWTRRSCGIGAKGFRVYDWALLDSDEPDRQYLIRRSLDTGELAYYRCYNPDHAGMTVLVRVAGARWPIEECFGTAKNTVGLDNYQVRTWNAWHRHTTLAMLAHTFLAITAHKTRKKNTPKKGDPPPESHHRPSNHPNYQTLDPPNRNPTPTTETADD